MTVAQLKRKLNKMPDDAVVIVENNHMYLHGLYRATSVLCDDEDNKVYIETDYKHREGEE